MANKALPWRRILLTAWTWPPGLTISPGTRTVRGDLNVRSPCLPAMLFLAIHSFLPETLNKKVTVISQKRLSLYLCGYFGGSQSRCGSMALQYTIPACPPEDCAWQAASWYLLLTLSSNVFCVFGPVILEMSSQAELGLTAGTDNSVSTI